MPLPFSHRLTDFKISTEFEYGDSIDISFIDDCPDPRHYKQRVIDRQIIAEILPQGDEMLFSCHTGQFLAQKEFTQVLLWAPFEKEIYDDYDGYPLLQIILWGRVSIRGGCYMHGAIVVIDDKYILLLGDSGAGKSTLCNLIVDQGYTSLTEENPFLTWKEDSPWVHSSPWYGLCGQKQPVSGKLSAIFFLRHSNENDVRKLSPSEAGRSLIGNARMFKWLPNTIPDSVDLLDNTIKRVPVYDFGFVPDKDAVETLKEFI